MNKTHGSNAFCGEILLVTNACWLLGLLQGSWSLGLFQNSWFLELLKGCWIQQFCNNPSNQQAFVTSNITL